MKYRRLATRPLHALLRSTFTRAAAGALGAATPLMALANPTGGQVVAGSATIGTAGANGTVINQSSQRAAINWQQFNVGANQYVQFVQPNSSSVVLNRVIGGNASQIFGSIRANGQVFLINPNGILFAPGASLDAQGLVASTLDISDADFMAGRYRFSKDPGAPDASVINDGDIQTAPGGYVVLAGDYARNAGSIDALAGRVVLAAGGRADLTLDGEHLISYVVDGQTLANMANVSNAGQIVATGGMVIMTADVANALTATAVNNTGLIAAHSVSYHGGEIVLEAQGGGIENSGTLDASGTGVGVAGGAVILHGDGDTRLTDTSQIVAWGNHARGGFVDVSGHDLTLKGGFNVGKGGQMLLDPSTIMIESGGTANSSSCVGCGGGVIHTNFIQHELNAGLDLTIIASNQIVIGSGDHGAGPATNITALTGNGKLSLKIGTTHIQSPSGGTLHRITSSIFNNSGALLDAFTPTANGTINLSGLTINIKGGFEASASHGNVTLGNITAASVTVTGANVTTGTLHATGLASTGDVAVRGSQSVAAFSSGHVVINGTVTADHGNVKLIAKGGGDVSGGNLTVTGAIKAGGTASISGHYIGSSSASGGGRVKLGSVSGQTVTITSLSSHPSISVGSINATQKDDGLDVVQVHAGHVGAGSNNALIKINGAITAAEGVFIAASGGHPLVSTEAITGNTKGCPISDCSAPSVSISAPHGTIQVNGTIVVDPDPFTRPGVFLDGRVIDFGNVTAPGNVSISAATISSINHAGITQAANATIKARDIHVDLNASYGGAIKLGNLIASSANGPAAVEVDAQSHNAGNSIVVGGNITVNGKGANRGFSSAMPGDGVPIAALVDLQASGSVAAAAYTIKVSGNITANAKPGAFNHTSPSCATCSAGGPRPTVHAVGTGGLAKVMIFTSGSHGSVNLGGNISVAGPAAAVNVKGDVIKVAGNVTTTGTGGSDSVDVLLTGSHGYHTHFVGPGPITNVSLGGASSAASVSVGGTVAVSGPGLIGVSIAGGKVALGGLNVTATAAASYSVLDTRVSTTTDKFTLGSAAVLVFQASNGSAFGPATVTGAVDVSAPQGNVFIESELKAGGQVALSAGKNVSGNATAIGTRIGEIGHVIGSSSGGSPNIPSAGALPLQLTATGVSMIAGGGIDLTSASIKTAGVAALKAGGDIVLSGVDINVGTFVAYAGGTIHNGGAIGTLSAGAVAFHAGKDLTLSSTDITVGSGSVPQDATTVNGNAALKAILSDTAFAATLSGDPVLASGLAAGGIPFTSITPNASFIAGGAVSLGSLTMKGSYLYLQGSSVSLGGAVTAPKGLVVQVAAASPTGTTDLEGKGAAGADLNLNNTGFLDQFADGTTLVLGASGQTGDISLGNNGTFDIGSDNLILDTSGNITGLGNVTSTGLVSSLEALLGSLVVPPTSGEIDPTSTNNNNAAGDKKRQNPGGESEGADSGQGGTITQDTSASSACH